MGGHHWIAKRVPDDCYVTMPNQLGIDEFDLTDALGEKIDPHVLAGPCGVDGRQPPDLTLDVVDPDDEDEDVGRDADWPDAGHCFFNSARRLWQPQ